jgi:hypothetical protein
MNAPIIPTTISTDLYWSLPGPSDFVRNVARAAIDTPMVFINTPKRKVPGTWEHVILGLKNAHIEAPVEIRVTDGNDIAAELGVHLGEKRMSAEKLASLKSPVRRAFILRPEGSDESITNAARYAAEFLNANPRNDGNIVLVIGICEDGLLQGSTTQTDFSILVFDGGLTPDEMEAYVNLRMIRKPGPGSTRLTRAIVSEFAGFDAEFAEYLMTLDEATLVSIIQHLPEIASQFPDRGRTSSWLDGMTSVSQPDSTHVLHEFHASRHGFPTNKLLMEKKIKARYFRAAVKIITPWLENNREEVLKPFKAKLDTIARKNGGLIEIPTTKDRVRKADPDTLEYNNINGMANEGVLVAETPSEEKALDVCRAATRVRNEIAHMRPPDPKNIMELVRKMDEFKKP